MIIARPMALVLAEVAGLLVGFHENPGHAPPTPSGPRPLVQAYAHNASAWIRWGSRG
jgi:hypothetical protein